MLDEEAGCIMLLINWELSSTMIQHEIKVLLANSWFHLVISLAISFLNIWSLQNIQTSWTYENLSFATRVSKLPPTEYQGNLVPSYGRVKMQVFIVKIHCFFWWGWELSIDWSYLSIWSKDIEKSFSTVIVGEHTTSARNTS